MDMILPHAKILCVTWCSLPCNLTQVTRCSASDCNVTWRRLQRVSIGVRTRSYLMLSYALIDFQYGESWIKTSFESIVTASASWLCLSRLIIFIARRTLCQEPASMGNRFPHMPIKVSIFVNIVFEVYIFKSYLCIVII